MNRTVSIMRLRKTKVFIVVFLIWANMCSSFAQDRKIDIDALVYETQKMSQAANEMTLVWWIPEEIWRGSLEQNPNITVDRTEEFLKVLRRYMIIVVIDGEVGVFGRTTYKPRTTIENNIQVIDRQGTYYRPFSDEKIDADIKNFLLLMKPLLANMLGPLGENLHFFLFPPKNQKGEDIAVAKREGAFSVKLDKREFKWRLPLGSLLPPKVCPVDGEKLNGAWKFCPWHGVELK